jgi:uncharacterized protein GlcG (DUF336 family)
MTSASHIIPYGPPLSLDVARKIASAAEAEAKANSWPMVIAIMDSGSNLVVLHKMDQAQTGSVTIAQAKAESAVRFKRPTKVFEEALTTGGINLRLLATHGACPLEGGLPLMVGGQLVGANRCFWYAIGTGRAGRRRRRQGNDRR